MTQPLSPAAQAVLDAVASAMEGGFISPEFIPYEAKKIAAALRALADQLAYGHGSSIKKSAIIDEDKVLDIATELEGADEPTFTPDEIEMIAAPWSYLQSQEELEDNND